MTEVLVEYTEAADHPALPGHFPGQPLVPGVVLLARVYQLARQRLNFAPGATCWRRIKFLGPVQPGQRCTITLKGDRNAFSFVITTCDDQPVARGQCRHDSLA
jgi:3-hydroxyacyl-[acyl-carrier-protein] dehydratase